MNDTEKVPVKETSIDESRAGMTLAEQIASLDQYDIVEAVFDPDMSDLKEHLHKWVGYRGLFRGNWFIDPDDHNGRWAGEIAFTMVYTPEQFRSDDCFGDWVPQSDLKICRVLTTHEKKEVWDRMRGRVK